MGDRQIGNQRVNGDQEDARRNLSEAALDPRNTGLRDTRVERTADTGDRAQFRSMCANELKGMRDGLHQASDAMKAVNEAVEQNKLKPGTPEWKAAVQTAAGAYADAIKKAEDHLYERNQDGSLKIDPQTKEPVLSNLGKQVAAERQNLAQDMDVVKRAQAEGRALTQQEMQRLGVRSNNPGEVMRDLKQADMMLSDMQRSAGYAHANLGLALIRASAGLPDSDKQAQIAAGQQELDNAAFLDKNMEADPNFQKHFKRVVKIATGQDIEYAGDGQQSGPERRGPNPDAKPTQDGSINIVRDGNMKIPTGGSDAYGPNFRSPFDILNQVEANLQSPLSKDNIDGFKAAIQTADSIDRAGLLGRWRAADGYLAQVRQGPEGQRVGSTLDAMDQAETAMEAGHATMAQYIPDITKAGGQKALDMLNALKQQDSYDKLSAFLNNPANAQAIREFQGLPKGAEFLSELQKFQSNNKQLKDCETVLNQYDPKIVEARKESARDKALYYSPLDARAHFVRALVVDPKNQSPENTAMAQKCIKEMAYIQPDLLNPNNPKSRDFLMMAQALGMGPDGKGGLDVVKPTDATTGGAAPVQLDQASLNSMSDAYQAYMAVKNGQPVDKAKFEAATAAAAKLTPEALQSLANAAQQELAQAGWNQQLETQYTNLNKGIAEAYSKIPEQTRKQQVDPLLDQISRIQSTDPTANDQRARLEAQLAGMSSDPAIKAFVDGRVALAKFQQDNLDKVAARMKFEQAAGNLDQLSHAKAITEGLYGAALVLSGDKASARDHLVKAASDPAALQLAPEITDAIQRSGDQTIMTDAQKLAQQQPPVDSTQRTGDGTAGGAQPNPQLYDATMQKIAAAQEALSKVQQTGQPLPADVAKVFTDAIAATDPKVIDPRGLQAMQAQLQQTLLQGWTQEQETKYREVNTNLQRTEAGVSQPAQQTINQFVSSLNPQDPNAQQAFDAKLRDLAKTDQTVAAYVAARDAAQQFYSQTPAAAKRDQYEVGTKQLAQLEHGQGITKTLYAAALATTGNPDDLTKAKQQITEAMQDKGLTQIFPQAAEVARQLQAGGGDGDTGIINAPAEMDKIPGFPQLRQAEQIMADKSIPMQQRIEKAGPLYEQAIEESKKINTGKLDTDLAAIGTRMQAIQDAAKTEQDQTKLGQMQQEYNQLAADAEKLSALRLEPMKARLKAAIASNSAAVELRDQASKDGQNKDALIRTADGLDKKAGDYLRGLEQQDPRMWRENPTVQGAIQQTDKHQKIDPNAANAIGQVLNVQKMVDFGVNGPLRGLQPLWVTTNLAGEALKAPSNIPVIGPVVGFIPGAIGAGLSREEEVRPGAAMALAMAKNKDPKAANDQVASIKHEMANDMVHIGADIGSSYLGIAAANLAVNMLPAKVGTVGRVLTFGAVGLGTTTASNAAIDWTANKVIGTDQRDFAELMSHSTASFAMTWGLKGLSNFQANAAEAAATGNNLSFGSNLGRSMQIWNPGISAAQATTLSGLSAEQNTALKGLTAAERATLTTAGAEQQALLSRIGITGEQAGAWMAAQRPTTFTGMLSGNGGRFNFAQAGEYKFTAAGLEGNANLQLGEQTANRLGNLRSELHPEFQQRVADKLASQKLSVEQFNAMSASQKAQFVNGVLDDMAAASTVGGKFSKLPFSGATNNARMGMVAEGPGAQQAAKDLFSRHWTETRMGNWGWRFGTGAGAMGVYGLGEVNPFLKNKDGQNYSMGDTVGHFFSNAAWGGGASLAAPLIGKAMKYTVVQPLKWTMAKPLEFVFNKEAAQAGKWLGVGRLEQTGFRAAAQELGGMWRIAGADTGSFVSHDVAKAAATRFVGGFGVGGGLGFLTHNPWATNPETGKKYTWGESLTKAGEWGVVGGGVGVAAPYALFAGKAGLEYLGKPVYNNTIFRGLGEAQYKTVAADGKVTVIGQRAFDKLAPESAAAYEKIAEQGIVTRGLNKQIIPGINSGRRALGGFADRWVVKPTTGVFNAAADSGAGQAVQSAGRSYINTSLGPTILLEGQAAGAGLYYVEMNRINAQADAILKSAREQQEKERQAAAAGQTQPQGAR